MEEEPLGKRSQISRKFGKSDEREEYLDITLRSIGDAVIAADIQGKVTLMNPVAERLTGWSEDEAAGKPLDEVFHIVNEETRRQVENPVARVMREGMVVGLANHTLLIARDGTERPITDSGAPIRDAQGEISGVVLTFRDQTAERAAQKALRESEERFRSIFDQASVSIWEEDFSALKQALDDLQARGVTDFRAYFDAHPEFVERAVGMVKVLDVNDETVRMFEADSKEDLLASLHKTFTPESLTTFRDELVALASGQSRFEQPAIVQTLGGQPLHILLRLTTLEGHPSLHRVLVSMMDITERVQAEQALARREAELRATFYSIGDAVIATDIQGQVTLVNPVAEQLTGWSEAEALGRPLDEIFCVLNEETGQPVEDPVARVLREGVVVGLANHTLLIARDGTERPISDSGAPIRDAQGDVNGVVLIFRDQTAEREAQKALRRLATVLIDSNDAVTVQDLEGNIEAWNRGAERMYGWSEEEACAMNIRNIVPENKQEEARAFLESIRNGQIAESFETQRKTKDGRHLDVWLTVSVLRDALGNPTEIATTARDITARKRAEEAMVRAAQDWQTTFDATSDVIWLLDKEQHVLRSNKAAERVFQQPREAFIGKHCWKIVHGTTQPVPECPLLRMKNSLRRESMELQIGEGWFNITVDPVLDADGEYAGAVHIISDITVRKQAEAELRKLNVELEQRVAQRTQKLAAANKEMEEFAYSVSHDLKAPVRAMIGFSEIIARRHRQSLNAEGQRYFDHILTAGQNMNHLIEDLLQYSRLGRKAVRLRPVPLSDLLFDLKDTFEERFQEAGGRLDIAEGFPTVQSDPTLLNQIFTNLVDNALSYHRPHVPPRVEIGWRTAPERLIVTVQDNGSGIPLEYCEKSFEIFQRLHSQEEQPGTGIGLALVKKAVALLEGRVWLESTVGEGTTFYVDLPMSDKESLSLQYGYDS